VDGTFVCDATAGDYFNGKSGDLQETPMTLTIEGGRLRKWNVTEDLEKRFWEYCHTTRQRSRGDWHWNDLGLSEMIGFCCRTKNSPAYTSRSRSIRQQDACN